MGRPTKLTREVRDKICKALAAGQTRYWAATSAGVGRSTLRRWMQQARDTTDPELLALRAGVKKAEAAAVAERLAVIRRAATGTTEKTVKTTVKPDGSVETVTTTRRVFEWTAAAWWLERMYPGDFGSRRPELAHLERLARYWDKKHAEQEARRTGEDPAALDLMVKAGLREKRLPAPAGGEATEPGVGGEADPNSI
jgi:hypothetical protein